MIILKFIGIDPDQLDEWINVIPKHWKDHRGASLWGVGMNLKSITDRQSQNQQLVVTDWEFSYMKGARTMIVFLFTTLEDSCEVFISWYKAYEERLAKTLEKAFESLSQVNY